jgi:hypothetical protein
MYGKEVDLITFYGELVGELGLDRPGTSDRVWEELRDGTFVEMPAAGQRTLADSAADPAIPGLVCTEHQPKGPF